jgi:hypothetical protein
MGRGQYDAEWSVSASPSHVSLFRTGRRFFSFEALRFAARKRRKAFAKPVMAAKPARRDPIASGQNRANATSLETMPLKWHLPIF